MSVESAIDDVVDVLEEIRDYVQEMARLDLDIDLQGGKGVYSVRSSVRTT